MINRKKLKEAEEILKKMKGILTSWDLSVLQITQDQIVEAVYDVEGDPLDLLDAYRIIKDFKELQALISYLEEEYHR